MVKVDHASWTGSYAEDKPLPPTAFDSSVEGKRQAVMDAVADYVGKHFDGARSGAGVFSKGGKVTVVISAEKVRRRERGGVRRGLARGAKDVGWREDPSAATEHFLTATPQPPASG